MESFCTYTVDDFKRLNKEYWINLMEKKHGEYETHYPMRSFDQSQVRSWADCFDVLQRVLKDFNLPGFYLIFEYILYAENGARPDVLLVSDKQVFVLEFKRKNVILEADIAQADMYGRFLKTCHVESRDKEIITCLVVTELPKDEPEKMNGSVHIVSPEALKQLLEDRMVPSAEVLDIQQWQQSKYEPDKNSVQRMVDMFKYGRLPHLKSAKSSKIPVATDLLVHLTERAKANHEHWLCFVSGVPGAGKTLLGIQYIYQMRKPGNPFFYSNATYVSGNGPLLKVLKGQLQYPDFMMGAQSFAHSFEQHRLNPTNLIVFDEAQRMWSEERMRAKNRGGFSENQQIVHIAGQTPWGVLVALVGEGQEIYAGEDGGIQSWVDAVPAGWHVACSPRYKEYFPQAVIEPALHLDVSIRSQGAEDVSKFVNALLDGKLDEAKALYQSVKKNHFRILITKCFHKAAEYCRELYGDRDDKKFGCITSSQNPKVKKTDIVRWFNDIPLSNASCCKLTSSQSEFDVEGLELDMPIIGWYEDLQWVNGAWKPFKHKSRNSTELVPCEPGSPEYRYRVNTYRVLMTRGRDGLVICVQDRPQLKAVYEVLKEVGLDEL